MGSFGISEGNITGRKKKKKPTEYAPNCNSWGEVAQMLVSATSERELNREARTALLRVRTGPETVG